MIDVELIEEQDELQVDVITNAVILKGFSPFIKNGTWWEYDKESQQFVDTGVKAQGQDGEQGPIGPQGPKGNDGADGSDYVITEADYNAIADITKTKVNVPTKVSELENDSEFITDDDLPKLSATYGTGRSSSGYLQTTTKTYKQDDGSSNNIFVGKGTLENVLSGKGYITSGDIPTQVKSIDIDDLTQEIIEECYENNIPLFVKRDGYIYRYVNTSGIYHYFQSFTTNKNRVFTWTTGASNVTTYTFPIGTIPTKTSQLTNDSGYITSDDIDDIIADKVVIVEFADLTSEMIENCYENNIALIVKRDGWIYRLSGGNSNETPTLYFQSLSSTTNRYFTYYFGDKKISKVGSISIPTTQAINNLIDAKIGALEPLADEIIEVIGL